MAERDRCQCIHEDSTGAAIPGSGALANPYIHEKIKIKGVQDYDVTAITPVAGVVNLPSEVRCVTVNTVNQVIDEDGCIPRINQLYNFYIDAEHYDTAVDQEEVKSGASTVTFKNWWTTHGLVTLQTSRNVGLNGMEVQFRYPAVAVDIVNASGAYTTLDTFGYLSSPSHNVPWRNANPIFAVGFGLYDPTAGDYDNDPFTFDVNIRATSAYDSHTEVICNLGSFKWYRNASSSGYEYFSAIGALESNDILTLSNGFLQYSVTLDVTSAAVIAGTTDYPAIQARDISWAMVY